MTIPVHNRVEYTRACLSSLRSQSFGDFTVVVIDDGSTDGTRGMLADEFPEVEVLAGDGTLWWTGAMNVGVGWALAQADPLDVVVALNNDTLPPPDFLDRLMTAHTEEPRGLIGSLLVRAGDRETVVDGGVRVHWPTARFTSALENAPKPECAQHGPALYPVDVLSGCGTLIPVGAFKLVGPYDELRLRHYAADYEFSRRARTAGFALFVDRASTLYVHEGETGLHSVVGDRDIRAFVDSLWSLRSANDLRLRWRFARRACPVRWQPTYIPCDYARVIVGSLKRHYAKRT